jgi:hypothetical protein
MNRPYTIQYYSWERSGIITLDEGLFNSVVASAIDEDDERVDLNSDNLCYHEETQID